jgi:hypothetical protein
MISIRMIYLDGFEYESILMQKQPAVFGLIRKQQTLVLRKLLFKPLFQGQW